MTKDYYKILGVTEFETAENIKIAYRKLARKYHPDVAGNNNDTLCKFKEINEAYEVLSNSIKKEEYDKARRFYNYAKNNSYNKSVNNNTYNNTTRPQTRNKSFSFNWEDFISKHHNNSYKEEEIKAPQKGKDIYSDIEISVFEALSGSTKIINMLQTEICPKCKGKKFANKTLCSHCNGKGEISHYKKFNVKIPAGIKNKSKIRLAGEGGKGINGGKNGDLYLTINIIEYKDYKIDGLNITKTISISPVEAILGATTRIKTIDGDVSIKLAPCTQNGQKIRLSGCGLVQNEKVGDMIITVEIKIPTKVSNEELSLYRKLEEISNRDLYK